MSPEREEASGGTNEVGAPDSGLWSDGLVLTPRVKDLFPVLGPVLTARPLSFVPMAALVKSGAAFAVASRPAPLAGLTLSGLERPSEREVHSQAESHNASASPKRC